MVAGDLYDRAIPPVEAVELFGEALARIAELRVPIVLISGNHDSAARLGFGADLIAAAGVHLRTDPTAAGQPVVLADEHGDGRHLPHPLPRARAHLGRRSAHRPPATRRCWRRP